MASDNEQIARRVLNSIASGLEHGSPWTDSDIERVADALDEAEARGAVKWRPVRERPVRPGWQLVLVGGDPEDVCRGYWNGVAWTLMSVTHWMPLPPPPSEER